VTVETTREDVLEMYMLSIVNTVVKQTRGIHIISHLHQNFFLVFVFVSVILSIVFSEEFRGRPPPKSGSKCATLKTGLNSISYTQYIRKTLYLLPRAMNAPSSPIVSD
jgi:hypothetical protein